MPWACGCSAISRAPRCRCCARFAGWRAEDGGELCIYHLDTSPQPACCQPSATGAEPSLPPADSDPAAAAVAPADMAAVRSGLQEGHAATVVPPVGGRLVLFDSSTEHEVLPSYAARYAVAVWFTRAVREGQAQAGRQQGGSERGVAGSGGSGSGSGSDSSSSREGQGQQEAAPAQQVAEAAAAAAPAPVPAASLLPAQDALHTAGDTQLACSPSQDAAVAGLAPPLQQGGITRPGHIFVSVASYRDSETQVGSGGSEGVRCDSASGWYWDSGTQVGAGQIAGGEMWFCKGLVLGQWDQVGVWAGLLRG